MADETFALSHPVICIVGPTASGKSDVAQHVAQKLDAEIVSADSMQIYRGMDIGTGKVLPCDRVVPHYGIDLVDPGEQYSAALFQAYARTCFVDIDTKGKRSVLCGGTGFYVRAAIDGYEFPKGEQVDNPTRERYTQYAEEHGALALWELLQQKDPRSAAAIHPNNTRRVVRAFEMLEEGASYADQAEQLSSIPQIVPARLYGLSVQPDLLVTRIEQRVDRMIEQGLVDEVRHLLDLGFREGVCAPQAIGYKEIVRVFDGEATLTQAVDDIKTATRRYAKRQRTWFRKDTRITWIDANERTASLIADEICERVSLASS